MEIAFSPQHALINPCMDLSELLYNTGISMKNLLISVLLICINLIGGAVALAVTPAHGTFHAHDDILSTAEEFIVRSVGNPDSAVSVKPLDRRLQLRRCSVALTAHWPPGARPVGHTSLGIRCDDHKPWKIFVGVHIRQYAEVWTVTSAVSRGTILDRSHVRVEKREVGGGHFQYLAPAHNPVGLMTKRPLHGGDILQSQALEKPVAVRRGDHVMVIARKDGLEIRAAAMALDSAAIGERIRVRNLSSKKELEGILRTNSLVMLNVVFKRNQDL